MISIIKERASREELGDDVKKAVAEGRGFDVEINPDLLNPDKYWSKSEWAPKRRSIPTLLMDLRAALDKNLAVIHRLRKEVEDARANEDTVVQREIDNDNLTEEWLDKTGFPTARLKCIVSNRSIRAYRQNNHEGPVNWERAKSPNFIKTD